MCINEAKRRKLEEKAFNELFADKHHNPKWRDMVKEAHTSAKKYITGGKEPRLDDVSVLLRGIIEAEPSFRAHQDSNGAREAEWVDLFADYVVDQVLEAGRGHT